MHNHRLVRAAGAAVLGLALSLSATAAQHGWTRTITTQRTATGHIRDTTIVNAAGRAATRHAEVVKDAAAGTRTRNVQYTGFDGRTATVNSVTQRTANGYTRDTTATGPNGKVTTRSLVATCDRTAQSCTRTISVNGGGG